MTAPGPNPENWSPLLAPLRALRAHYRFVVCGIIGAGVGMLLATVVPAPVFPEGWRPLELGSVTRGLIGWDVAVLLYLVTAARMVRRATHGSIRQCGFHSDEGRNAALFLTATATCVAIGAILAELVQSKALPGDEKAPHILLAIVTVFLSWAFMHLIFALHDAHEFYAEAAHSPKPGAQWPCVLRFPNTPTPQNLDFLYFSFVIGVACQTADVEICARRMRAGALARGIVAFFFNTTILALMVNIASQFV